MRVNLTPRFVLDAAKPAAGKDRVIYWDVGRPGFGLMVTAGGHHSFVIQYRNEDGRSRRAHLKGGLSLSEARKQARIIQGDIAKGKDPVGQKRALAARSTFQTIAEDYVKREGRKLRSLNQRKQALERLIYPALGKKPIDLIKRSDIVKLLDEIEDQRGAPMADQVLMVVRRIMGWHAARDDDFRSPIVRGMSRSNAGERARTRILDDDEIRAVWRTADTLATPFARMLQFILVTAVRRTEASRMDRCELDGSVWTIPAARMKGGLDHVVPLSSLAQAVLRALPVFNPSAGPVFTHDGAYPLSNYDRPKKAFDEKCGVSGWTIHDLRRTARSLMSRAGVHPDHGERALAHVIGGIRGIYDRHEFFEEKKFAFEAVAGQIQRMLDQAPNVVVLRGGANS